ncbi:META domain-containing protein [Streptomyces sp. XM83C]|uniref:META domain-containing protein n=1 Tax=Streptomyces sp. XM83C TaxID=2929781 RepID=UPI001FFC026D|nr:META domain-containing protein [Streptomyces sp. XM83C]MCK1822697.1 META domain-containing protein [Streptomyces sp. XM83C]
MDRQRHPRRPLAAAVLVPLLAACADVRAGPAGSDTVGPEPQLAGTDWRITRLSTPDRTERPGSTTHLRIDREAGTVAGRLGCNRFAAATVSDGHITLGSPTTTRMMCDASLMRTERMLLDVFESAPKYRIRPGTLTLTCANGTIIEAVPWQ